MLVALDTMEGRGLESSTLATARNQLIPLIRKLTEMKRITRALVQTRIEGLQSIASRVNTLRETNRFIDFCVKKGWLPRNPASGIVVEGKIPTGKVQLTRSEARVLVGYQREDLSEGATFTMLLIMTGARKSEILYRKVRDVDVTACKDTDGREYGVIEIRKAKTKAGERVLRVYEPALARLRAQVKDKGFEDYLFPGEGKGKPHGRDWPNHVLTRQCVAAGVTIVPPHGLRGTVASWSKEVGVIGAAISRDLGHNGQAVTNRHYVKADAGAAARTRQIASTLAPVKKVKRGTKVA